MKIVLVGSPPFPAAQLESGQMLAKMEHIWHAARRWAQQNGYEYTSTYGVIGVAPT
jgi:hypothetical protein